MRRSNKSTALATRSDSERAIDRRGMLQSTEQRPEGYVDSAQTAVGVEILIDFIRSLIRINPSQDAVFLAFYSVSNRHGMTKEQSNQFIKAVLNETKKSPWPEGFF